MEFLEVFQKRICEYFTNSHCTDMQKTTSSLGVVTDATEYRPLHTEEIGHTVICSLLLRTVVLKHVNMLHIL